MLPAAALLSGQRTIFFGNDAYYHMRRIEHALGHFPHVLSFDAYLNFPDGARPIWPPLFDALVALLLFPIHAAAGMDAVERVVLWIPPLVGGLCVVTTYALGRFLFDWRVGLVAGLFLSLASGHYWYSQAGFIDHHCAVALAATLLAWRTAVELGARASRGASLRNMVVLGVLSGGALLLWPGALLYVAIAECALFIHCATRPKLGDAQRAARQLALANIVALGCVAPFALDSSWPQWGAMSPTVISGFQPWAFGVLAGCAVGCHFAFARSADPRRRLVTAVALGIGLVAASLLLLPALREGAGDAWQWLARDESFQSRVSESNPLFVVNGELSVSVARERLSDFVFLFPLALAGLIASRNRSAYPRATLFLALSAAALACVTIAQRRFFNEFTPQLAIVFGWSLVQFSEVLQRQALRRTSAAALASVVALGLLWPSLGVYRAPLQRQLEWWQGEPVAVGGSTVRKRALVRAAAWLRAASPAPADWMLDEPRPAYGVITSWDRGHLFLYTARRAMAVGNFGDDLGGENMALVDAYFASEEARAFEVATGLRARYVVSRPLAVGPPATGGAHSMRVLLAGANKERPGLAHHRLVYQSLTHRTREPLIRIYELVPGAQVLGQTTPGTAVTARLTLMLAGRAPLSVHYEAQADENGEYRLRVPYATGHKGAVSTGARLTLGWAGAGAELEIPESAVRHGSTLRAPPLLPM